MKERKTQQGNERNGRGKENTPRKGKEWSRKGKHSTYTVACFFRLPRFLMYVRIWPVYCELFDSGTRSYIFLDSSDKAFK